MTKEEIIVQIDAKKKELNGLHPIDPDKAHRIIQNILDLINDLIELTPDDRIIDNGELEEVKFYEVAWSQLAHTKGNRAFL